MRKKPTVSVTYENERISIKNSLPYIKCVLRLSWVVQAPFYGLYSIRDLASRRLCTESESKVANLCNLSRLKPSTEARPELRVTVDR